MKKFELQRKKKLQEKNRTQTVENRKLALTKSP